MTRAIDLSHDQSYTKVTFSWEDGEAKYTDWTSDLPGDFTSTPSISIELPSNTVGLEQAAAKIALPSDEFTTWLTDGHAKPIVYVLVEEVISHPDGVYASTLLIPFNGIVKLATRNYSRRSNVTRIEAVLDKHRLDTPLGVPCTHQCPWVLYGAGCALNPVLYRTPLIVTDISGRDLTVHADPSKDDNWFTRGTAIAAGVSLTIREWRAATPTTFTMMRRPPLEWVGQSVSFYAGCDKTKEMCVSKFNNGRKWGGIGAGIPAFNPLYEEAP